MDDKLLSEEMEGYPKGQGVGGEERRDWRLVYQQETSGRLAANQELLITQP